MTRVTSTGEWGQGLLQIKGHRYYCLFVCLFVFYTLPEQFPYRMYKALLWPGLPQYWVWVPSLNVVTGAFISYLNVDFTVYSR
jgi:hypothetical protein